jgi:nicotinate-nucleotide pyrophosphorylase
MTADKKVIRFDKAGNDQAKKFIAEMKKAKDIQVEVTGAVTGDTMTVSKIVLQ